jgi:hypothetical protein
MSAPQKLPFDDAAALEAWLSRLPPAQPCLSCSSHDSHGELRFISPELETVERDGEWRIAALFRCPLCGAARTAELA